MYVRVVTGISRRTEYPFVKTFYVIRFAGDHYDTNNARLLFVNGQLKLGYRFTVAVSGSHCAERHLRPYDRPIGAGYYRVSVRGAFGYRNIVSLSAVAGAEDGSVIVSRNVDGREPEK